SANQHSPGRVNSVHLGVRSIGNCNLLIFTVSKPEINEARVARDITNDFAGVTNSVCLTGNGTWRRNWPVPGAIELKTEVRRTIGNEADDLADVINCSRKGVPRGGIVEGSERLGGDVVQESNDRA